MSSFIPLKKGEGGAAGRLRFARCVEMRRGRMRRCVAVHVGDSKSKAEYLMAACERRGWKDPSDSRLEMRKGGRGVEWHL